MKFKANIPAAAGLAIFLLGSHSARSAVVIDNLTGGTLTGTGLNISGPTASFNFGVPIPFGDREVAIQFQTGANPATLDQIEFAINVVSISLNAVDLTLSTGASAPGGTGTIPIASFSPTMSGSNTITVTPSSTVNLDANTSYWLHFVSPAGNSIYALAGNSVLTTAPGWSITSVNNYDPTAGWSGNLTTSPAIRLSATEIVPEPSGAALGGFGLLLLLMKRRRH